MIGAEDATSDVFFAVAISAGGVAVATVIGLWIRARRKREDDE